MEKKIAICFWGITRSLKYTLPSIKKHILSILPENIKYDIYLHTYNFEGTYINPHSHETGILDFQEYELLNPKYYIIDNQDEIKKTIDYEIYKTYGNPWKNDKSWSCFENMFLGLYSKLRVTNLLIEKNQNYDNVIFLRPDVKFLNDFPLTILNNINLDTIYTPSFHKHGGLNDRFFVSNYKNALIYGKIYEHLLEISKIRNLHSESIQKYYLLTMNNLKNEDLQFYFNRVRCKGNELKDCKEKKLIILSHKNFNLNNKFKQHLPDMDVEFIKYNNLTYFDDFSVYITINIKNNYNLKNCINLEYENLENNFTQIINNINNFFSIDNNYKQILLKKREVKQSSKEHGDIFVKMFNEFIGDRKVKTGFLRITCVNGQKSYTNIGGKHPNRCEKFTNIFNKIHVNKNFDIFISLFDGFQLNKQIVTYVNTHIYLLVSELHINSNIKAIIIPDLYVLEGIDDDKNMFDKNVDVLPFHVRRNIAKFIGAATGHKFTYENKENVPRFKACYLSIQHPQLLDCKFSKYVNATFLKDIFGDPAPIEGHNKMSDYKYLLSFDGNVSSWKRPESILHSYSVPFFQTKYNKFYSELLVPFPEENANYVKIENDLSNLIEMVEYFNNNQDKAQEIANNAKNLANSILTDEFIFEFLENKLNYISDYQ